MKDQAIDKISDFLTKAGEDDLSKMHMDFSVDPPVLIFEDGEKYLAMDPSGSKVFLDKELNFVLEYNFSADPEVFRKVDLLGKKLLDKATQDYIPTWLENMNL